MNKHFRQALPFLLNCLVLPAALAAQSWYDTLKNDFHDLPISKELTAPFFWMHGETDQVLKDWVKIILEGGNGNYVIESRPHPDWMGPGWFADVKLLLEEGAKYGVSPIIYDERMWPSFAIGNTIQPAHRARLLRQTTVDVTGPQNYSGNGYSGATYILTLAGKWENNAIVGESLVDLTASITGGQLNWSVPAGQWKIIKFYYDRDTHPLVDLATEADMNWWLDTVVKPHYQLGPTNIAGWFYDEPEYYGTWGLGLENDLKSSGVDYKKIMASRFYTMSGTSNNRQADYEYWEALGEKIGRTCYGAYSKYVNARGSYSIGHFNEVEVKPDGKQLYLEHGYGALNMMELQKYSDMGAIDLVIGQVYPRQKKIDYEMPKLASSISHTNNKKEHLTMCEIFGGYGQGLSYTDMKWLSDWHIMQGVNLLVPHSFNPKDPDGDYPPYFYYYDHEPRWPLYKVWCDRQNRLSYMTRGNDAANSHVAPVAFLWPGYSRYAGLVEFPENMEMALQTARYDFDLLTFNRFMDSCTLNAATKSISLFNENYRILVVPPVEYIPYATMQKIKQFFDLGGVVIGYLRVPSKSAKFGNTDAELQGLTSAVWGGLAPAASTSPVKTSAAGGKAYFLSGTTEAQLTPPLKAVLKNCGISSSFTLVGGNDDQWLQYLHRKRFGMDVFMIWNGNAGPNDIVARLQATGTPELWEPTTGAISTALYRRNAAGEVDIHLKLAANEAMLVVFRPTLDPASVMGTKAWQVLGPVTKSGSVYTVNLAVAQNGLTTTWVHDNGSYYSCDTTFTGIPDPITIVNKQVSVQQQYLGAGYLLYIDAGSASTNSSVRININGDYTTLQGVASYAGGMIESPKWIEVTGKLNAGANRIQFQPTDPGNAKLRIMRKVTVSNFKQGTPPGNLFLATANLAFNKTVNALTSAENNASWSKPNLVDGVTDGSGTLGYTSVPNSSQAVNEWVEVDLGANMDFSQVMLYPRADLFTPAGTSANYPVDFTIQVKADGAAAYTTVYTVTGGTNPKGVPQIYNFATQNARYVRINVTKLGETVSGENGVYRLQLAEMEIYNITKTSIRSRPAEITGNTIRFRDRSLQITMTVIDPSSRVQINLLDLRGKTVCEVYSGTLNRGMHTVKVHTGGMGRGTYLLAVRVDGQRSIYKTINYGGL